MTQLAERSEDGAGTASEEIVLAAREVRKVFDGQVRQEVLGGITLDFPRGQFASIVGPSGSGKSTLLYILGALDRATSGSVRVAGRAVEALSQNELADLRNERIGFVFQFHFLLPEFTALENVLMPAMIAGKRRDEVREHGMELLRRVGLAEKANKRSTRLSGGEQQRVAIARALVNQPQLVLCDEPTGNLDTANSRAVYELLRELNLENRQTILVVTHDPEFAARTDRVVHLVDGLVDSDTYNDSDAAPRA
jgi:lipoprotein-releasing system ATP-binding protein